MGRHSVDSNMLFISDLWIPEQDRIGAEGEGFGSSCTASTPSAS